MTVSILFVGKPRDFHCNALAADFLKRSTRFSKVEMREIRERADLPPFKSASRVIALDPRGKTMDSAEFASLVGKAEMEGRDLVFLIGGHDGLSPAWQAGAEMLLSLGPMTLPHELARVILAEQVYRAFATLRHHPYPR